jgi:hypothetical protein
MVDENQSELRLDVLESVELHEPVATGHQLQRRASMVSEEVAEDALTLCRSLAR